VGHEAAVDVVARAVIAVKAEGEAATVVAGAATVVAGAGRVAGVAARVVAGAGRAAGVVVTVARVLAVRAVRCRRAPDDR
jgi:hypothetical protein